MEGQGQLVRSRVVKLDTEQAWDSFLNEANERGCPVFVHFTASWCVPSVAMNPFVEELAYSFQDVLFLLVDVDEAKAVAARMEVKAMPTFVLMKDGNVVTKIVGANPDELRKTLENFVASSTRGVNAEQQ